jgi:hypothetical protein
LRCSAVSLHRGERTLQVGAQVFQILDADGEPYQ